MSFDRLKPLMLCTHDVMLRGGSTEQLNETGGKSVTKLSLTSGKTA